MSDLLGEALAAIFPESEDEFPNGSQEQYDLVEAAARNWHALTNPTDELIERLIATLDQLPELNELGGSSQ